MNHIDKWRNLNKTAQTQALSGLGMGALSGLSGKALYAAALLPVLAGGAGGYLLEKQNQPEKMDFRNLGKEHMLAELNSQIAQTKKLNEIREEREEAREEGSTDVGQSAGREIHIPT